MRGTLGLASLLASVLVGQTVAPNATDRMMALANARFGKDYWRKSPVEKYGADWMRSPLRSDPDLARIEIALERRFSVWSPATTLEVDRLRTEALAHPDDPHRMFSWGYAAFLQAGLEGKRGGDYWNGYDRFQQLRALNWLLAAAPGGGYEYVRLRFLLGVGGDFRNEFAVFGNRLLVRSPSDAPVKRATAYALSLSRSPWDLARAETLADELIKREPNRLSYIGLEQFVHTSRWMVFKHRPEDALNVLKWSRRYLALAPPDAPNRENFERTMRYVSASLPKGHGLY